MKQRQWAKDLKEYAKPNYKKAIIQIINTLVPYIILLTLSLYLFQEKTSPILLIPVLIASAGFMVRVFILFHDCTHLSFVKSNNWNQLLGTIFGIFTFTPFVPWQKEHTIHHGTVGNLQRRGSGDIWTMTVKEYDNSKWYKKVIYRIYRNPIFLFGVAPISLFAVLNRLPKRHSGKSEWTSYMITNLGIIIIGTIYGSIFSIKDYLIVQLITLAIASSLGVWLFYIQHQFEEVYWEENESWDFVDAALKGSTFYRLPTILEWISGYIGYHHIHHLNSKIPNYNLKVCYKNNDHFTDVKTVTLVSSLPLALLQLYDENKQALISFKQRKSMLKLN
ncbi:fatty acid desaturase [Vallitalea okinawensis]|uniref:fatty acid desaturase n=1 Tax=Vallitalea okinawensis TaxID=2078660 RepID=UPI0013008904|nr:fatty acid desaturase [Vallitalea okinawensis]